MKDIKLEQIKPASAQGTAAVYLVRRAHSGAVVGMLEKFRDTRTDTHPWKAFAGYGEGRKFIGPFYKEDGGKEAAIAAVATWS